MFNKFLTDTAEAGYLRSKQLNASAALVLLKLMYRVNRYNIVEGSPSNLSWAMGISLWDFNHGVRVLKKMDLVRKYSKWEYMVNPQVMFNGEEKQRQIVRQLWNNQTKRGFRQC